jgi:large subunit ribosomal protein L19
MTNIISNFEKEQVAKILASRTSGFEKAIKIGDLVSVKYKITEGTNVRIQAFNGVVIAKAKDFSNYAATFTVRKISSGIGVERKFTYYSPLLAGVEILKSGMVRRAKLYYLRNLTGKASRIKEKMDYLPQAIATSAETKAA